MTAGEAILDRSATELHRHLLRRDISATELLRMTLGRFERENPRLSAVVSIDHQSALDAATESDKRISAGAARSLEGLPVTIKDSYDVASLPATSGSRLYCNRRAGLDAPAVARLRAAGAIIIGKTNVSEAMLV